MILHHITWFSLLHEIGLVPFTLGDHLSRCHGTCSRLGREFGLRLPAYNALRIHY
jgi:hypothetical protein